MKEDRGQRRGKGDENRQVVQMETENCREMAGGWGGGKQPRSREDKKVESE